MKNSQSLETLCAALAEAMGIDPPLQAAVAAPQIREYRQQTLGDQPVDRIFMYNPDAIAQWIYEKYPHFFIETVERTELAVPFCTVMPAVTPVCFGTMYTGALPAVHGIQSYVKPVITIDTLFDALIRNGKRPAIVSTSRDSLSQIYLSRDMDYFIYDTVDEIIAKATEVIAEDKYDFIAIYNTNFDFIPIFFQRQ